MHKNNDAQMKYLKVLQELKVFDFFFFLNQADFIVYQ